VNDATANSTPVPSGPGETDAVAKPIKLSWGAHTRKALTLGEDPLFLLLSVLIGTFSGLAVVCFRIAIDWTRWQLLGSSLAPPAWRVLAAPTVAGLAVALMLLFWFSRARGSGVNQTKAAVYIFDGYVPFRTVIGKFLCCALAIGSGQSLGPEDPSLQMGAGIASLLGRRIRLSQEKLRLIAPVGAAAGLAAAFNAPISAVLFVIEEIIGTWSGGMLGAIMLSAVSSVVVMRGFLGSAPLFRIPAFRLQNPLELLGYAVLGIAGGGASILFMRIIAWARPRLRTLPNWTQHLQPAAAGFLVGLIGLKLPQVMGAGYPSIDRALHGDFTWRLLLLLAAAKIVATSFSFISGTPGGLFAPTLFIGAMIGGAVGGLEVHFFHQLGGSEAAFALVGMGTLFAGFLRTPITSVFMVVEITGNYSIILPVMISNLLAYVISRHYQPVPLFDLLSRQDGVVLPSLEEIREQRILRVEDAVRELSVPILGPGEKVGDAWTRNAQSAATWCLVAQRSGGWKIISTEELRRAASESPETLVAALAARGPIPSVFPDQRLEEALPLMSDWPFLAVTSRVNSRALEGVISMDDILKAYRST
jgi:chloride channel protein, CIC family